MITDKNILASKHTKSPWRISLFNDTYEFNSNPGFVGVNILNISDVGEETAKANADIASAAPEAIEFIADLISELEHPGFAAANWNKWIDRGEEILKKAYNF